MHKRILHHMKYCLGVHSFVVVKRRGFVFGWKKYILCTRIITLSKEDLGFL